MPNAKYYGAVRDKGQLCALFTTADGTPVIMPLQTLSRAFFTPERDQDLMINPKAHEAKALTSRGISASEARKAFAQLSDSKAMRRAENAHSIPSADVCFRMMSENRGTPLPEPVRIGMP
jgi:hypothetical protein